MFTEHKQINNLGLETMSPTHLKNIAKATRPNEHFAGVYPASKTKQ
jgi:hypothetical protein